jgi:hypothetical protein
VPGDFLFEPPYDPDDRESCLRHARRLQKAGTLRKAIHLCVPVKQQAKVIKAVESTLKAGGKGAFGNAIEVGHFYYQPNSSAKPDLGWAELKCTGLLPDGDGGRRAKERLVICMINYGGNSASKIPCVVEETAETSHAFQKLLSVLLVFYDYAKVSRPEELMDLPIRLVDIWAPAPSDIALFKRDWEVIQGYVRDGRAHELTEGLTPMLGACTKSSDSTKMVKQRVGKALAKPRAFALKQAYVTEIFRSLYSEQAESKLMESPSPGYAKVYFEQDLESEILSRVNAYVGMTTIEICKRLKLEAKFGGKSGHSRRIRAFLNTISMKLYALPVEDLEPFRKSGFRIAVSRVLENDEAAESVSFPAFDYAEIADEQEWEDSSLYQDLVKRFLFVFLRDDKDGSCPRLAKAVFWSMPERDLDATLGVWADTVKLIRADRLEELPAESQTKAVHVRPHDKHRYPGFKRSFWLNRRYVSKIWRGDAAS